MNPVVGNLTVDQEGQTSRSGQAPVDRHLEATKDAGRRVGLHKGSVLGQSKHLTRRETGVDLGLQVVCGGLVKVCTNVRQSTTDSCCETTIARSTVGLVKVPSDRRVQPRTADLTKAQLKEIVECNGSLKITIDRCLRP